MAAVLSVCFLKRKLSKAQWLSIFVLFVGIMLVQKPADTTHEGASQELAQLKIRTDDVFTEHQLQVGLFLLQQLLP